MEPFLCSNFGNFKLIVSVQWSAKLLETIREEIHRTKSRILQKIDERVQIHTWMTMWADPNEILCLLGTTYDHRISGLFCGEIGEKVYLPIKAAIDSGLHSWHTQVDAQEKLVRILESPFLTGLWYSKAHCWWGLTLLDYSLHAVIYIHFL